MPYRLLLIVVTSLLFSGGTVWVAAQATEDTGTCSAALETLWTVASDACVGGPTGHICNGGQAPQAQPEGNISNALAQLGAMVEVGVVQSLHSPPLEPENGTGGLVWLRLADPIALTGILIGDVAIENVTPANFPAWQSMVVQTSTAPKPCTDAPHNALILQTPIDATTGQVVSTGIVINGTSLVFSGTLLIETNEAETLFVNLGGSALVLARGQERSFQPGQQISIPYNPGEFSIPAGVPGNPVPMDVDLSANLPIGLLDRPQHLPQPGYVSTTGQVNMRSLPSTDGGIVYEVPAGQVMSVLGTNPAGDWLHVRMNNGLTGWMFAELLQRNTGEIRAVYESTPLPPQRYGELGTSALVVAPAGVNIRQAPDVQFGSLATLPPGTNVTLLERSPYSPWVKVQHGELIGWAALIALETHAIIESLPVDYDVPPPPEPTRIPGSFGNAFPDPRNNN